MLTSVQHLKVGSTTCFTVPPLESVIFDAGQAQLIPSLTSQLSSPTVDEGGERLFAPAALLKTTCFCLALRAPLFADLEYL